MFRIAIIGIIGCLILTSMFIFAQPARGEERGNKLALVIVSGHGGYTPSEVNKGSAFRKYLLDNGVSQNRMKYLTSPSDQYSDGIASVNSVINAFQWLINNSLSIDEVTIYISDHAWWIDNIVSFKFDDGNLSAELVDTWLDVVECSSMNIILNGPRSGLAGTDLTGSQRSVFCSMKGYQEYDSDQFNITRSLLDPVSDKDHNGEITYLEAFEMEKSRLLGSGQEPVKYT